jgi:hypothetical protein
MLASRTTGAGGAIDLREEAATPAAKQIAIASRMRRVREEKREFMGLR